MAGVSAMLPSNGFSAALFEVRAAILHAFGRQAIDPETSLPK
jgi:hypothetical protein